MKTCSKCGESKPLEGFHKNKSRRDGLQTYCRKCVQVTTLANKERIRVTTLAWRETNKEKHRATSLAYRAANKNHKSTTVAAWAAANRERRAATNAAYVKAHPEKSLEAKFRRRALKANNGVNLVTSAETAGIIAMPCTACKAPSPSEIDHIIPLARGGSHTIGNLMPLCPSCNRSKNDMLYTEWKHSSRPQALKAFAAP